MDVFLVVIASMPEYTLNAHAHVTMCPRSTLYPERPSVGTSVTEDFSDEEEDVFGVKFVFTVILTNSTFPEFPLPLLPSSELLPTLLARSFPSEVWSVLMLVEVSGKSI